MRTTASFDPGGDTGWVLHTAEGFKSGVFDEDNHHLTLWEWLERTQPDLVICEEFTYQRRELDEGVRLVMVSLEYIGICRLWCKLRGRRYFQSALVNKAWWDDTKLRRAGLYYPNKHARDAMRHLLYYITFKDNDKRYLMRLKK